MFRVRVLSEKDFPFAISLTDTMGWGLAEEDFRFMLDLEPNGCFVVMEDGKAVGIATTINFGQVGWVGNVIIEKDRRNRGIGSLLVEHALDYLKERKTEIIGLYAYLRAVPLYSRLGFRSDTNFVVLEGQAVSKPARGNVRAAEDKDLAGILNLDSCCFGGVRRRLLERIFSNKMNLCYVGCSGDELLGFVFAKRYSELAEVGPLVCRREFEKLPIDLLYAILGDLSDLKVRICVAEDAERVFSTLRGLGFNELFKVVRMFYGGTVSDNGCLVAAESLERG